MAGFAITGMDLSGFMVKDAKRAIAFYRDVFGLEPALLYPDDRGAEYELPDGSTFGLWGAGGRIPFQPSNGILFSVDNFDEAVATLKARGTPIAMEFETPNCRMAVVADTEGNSIFLHDRRPLRIAKRHKTSSRDRRDGCGRSLDDARDDRGVRASLRRSCVRCAS